jgi:CRP-like cAMP-binding protein
MEVVYPRCCGIDIHKASVCCCISIKDGSRNEKQRRRFDTTTAQLREMAGWLQQWKITTVAMEATGVYWKPVWNLLEKEFELLLVNPQHLKSIPGKKTDFKDGERIADLLQHGLLRGSFVPPREIRQLRDLTRMRASLARERSSVINRAVVQIAGEVIRMRAKLLQAEFAQGGPLQHLLLLYTQALITQISQTAVCNRLHSVEKRLCRWLLLSQDRVKSDELPMTQEFISNMLGGRRESVTVAAVRLQSTGLIHYARGHIIILDRKGLEATACECYQIVKTELDRLIGATGKRYNAVNV